MSRNAASCWPFVVGWLLMSSGVGATGIEPLWQVEAFSADFIGVVECEVAGGFVAPYRVVESWKGPKAGERIELWQDPEALCGMRFVLMAHRKPPGYGMWRGLSDVIEVFKVSWVTERPSYEGARMIRRLPLEKVTAEEASYLPPELKHRVGQVEAFGEYFADFADVRRTVRRFVRSHPMLQEAQALRAAALQEIDLTSKPGNMTDRDWQEFLNKLQRTMSADEIVSLLLTERFELILARAGGPVAFARVIATRPEDYPGGAYAQARAIRSIRERHHDIRFPSGFHASITAASELRSIKQAARRRAQTAQRWRDTPVEVFARMRAALLEVQELDSVGSIAKRLWVETMSPQSASDVARVLVHGANEVLGFLEVVPSGFGSVREAASVATTIRLRLGLAGPPEDASLRVSETKAPQLTPEVSGQLHDDLRRDRSTDDRGQAERAFIRLLPHDQDAVTHFLLTRPVGADSGATRNHDEQVIRYYAKHCSGDRSARFRALLEAQNPTIRTGAAVFLAQENETEGVAAIKSLVSAGLPLEEETWAMVDLARRGDKQAVDRILEMLRSGAERPVAGGGYPRAFELVQLLSNSAKASQLPQPPIPSVFFPSEPHYFERLQSWWNRHRGRIILRDPWLEELARQHLD